MTRSERQELGVRKWMANGCRATLNYCTGFGKSRTAIIAIKAFLTKNKGKTIKIIVPTDHLKVQWLKSLSEVGLFNDVSVEIVNSSVRDEEKVDFLILDGLTYFVEYKLI